MSFVFPLAKITKSVSQCLLCCLLVNCGGGESSNELKVVSSAPADGASRISTDSTLKVMLSNDIDVATLTTSNVVLALGSHGEIIRTRISYEQSSNTITVTPRQKLLIDSFYTLNLQGIRDRTGNEIVATKILFRTYENPISSGIDYSNGIVTRHYVRTKDSIQNSTRLVTYSNPGIDSQWFTDDDVVEGYSETTFDVKGNKIREAFYSNTGLDKVPYTSDDELFSYNVTTYDDIGRPSRAARFYSGVDGVAFNADDIATWFVEFIYDRHPGGNRWIVYSASGADGVPFSADDVVERYIDFTWPTVTSSRTVTYIGTGTDRVWFTTDDELLQYVDRLTVENNNRSSEIYYSHRGLDGILFNDDDIVSGYFLSLLNSNGDPSTIIQAYPGPDRVLFNDDDLVGYYVSQFFDSFGNVVRRNEELSPGNDRQWYTPDDIVLGYTLSEFSGRDATKIVSYSTGPDEIALTTDDQVRSYELYSYAENGNKKTYARYENPGADGIWFNADDQPSNTAIYDTNT